MSSIGNVLDARKPLSLILKSVVEEQQIQLLALEFDNLLDQLVDHYFGLGLVDSFRRDDSIHEILINSFQEIYFERRAKLHRASVSFQSDAHFKHVIDRFCIQNRVALPSQNKSVISFTLSDNSLVTILFPPVIPHSAALSIRRYSKNPITIDQLIKFGVISPEMLQFLNGAVEAGLNILVCGHLGAGANTLVNVLSGYIPGDERVISIEYVNSFSLRINHLIKLIAEESPAGERSYRKMLALTEKLRGDRLVLGEFASPEAYDVLNKVNDSFSGSIIRVVAKSPTDAVNRLETLVQMGKPHLPVAKIRHLISSSLDLIVYQERLRDGTRAVRSIVEVVDDSDIEGQVVLREIFSLVQTGVKDGRILRQFLSNGPPSETLMNKFESVGINLPPSLFASTVPMEKGKELTEADKRVIKLSKGNYVFVSYSSKDYHRVNLLAKELEKNNFSVWLDKWYLEPGQDWSKALEKAIKNAGAFLVVLTSNSVDAPAVRGEILTAQDQGLPIIPVKMEECNIPLQIKTLQYILYERSDFPGTMNRISETLSKYIQIRVF